MAGDHVPVSSNDADDALRAEVDLPLSPEAAALARRTVRDVLRSWRLDSTMGFDAQLATSELVSNAIRHGGHHVRLVLELTHEWLRISVSDGSSTLPSQRPGEDDGEGGRGLLILASLGEWGVEATATGGKQVWVHLPLAR
jgi:anti-sigma regulatory factor (Ser/Thr protein kinase)